MDTRETREAWLERAMGQYEESLLRMCFACLNDAALAEDAVQETFLKAYRALDRFRGDAEEKRGCCGSPSTPAEICGEARGSAMWTGG